MASLLAYFVVVLLAAGSAHHQIRPVEGQFIKNVINTLANVGSGSAQKVVPESAPICGAPILSSDQQAISPEMIFISNRLTREIGSPGQSNLHGGNHGQSGFNNQGHGQSDGHGQSGFGDNHGGHGGQSGHNQVDGHGGQSGHNQVGGHGGQSGHNQVGGHGGQSGHNQVGGHGQSGFNNQGQGHGGGHNHGGFQNQGLDSGYPYSSSGHRNRRPSSRPRSKEDGEEREERSAIADSVLNEFRFNVDNVSMDALIEQGFNPKAPITILIHGFTSGYPLQAWMTSIVDIYTINERKNPNREFNSQNLFIVNWHYAARSVNYPRAVANVPVVAAYVVKFIDRLVDELRVNSRRIQLVGHSLGSHVAGFVGKNTKTRIGRIYGLDPAGPCFGTVLFGKAYPPSQRLGPNDAEEVITIVTNSELLGLDEPLGQYSVFVEGGKNQPGCKPGAVNSLLGNLATFTVEGGDVGAPICSHSRAPLLMAFRHHQGEGQDDDNDCQLVAYECSDWTSFKNGHCGYCDQNNNQCLLVGLNWQYPNKTRHTTGGSSSYNGYEPLSSQYGNYYSENGAGGGHGGSSFIEETIGGAHGASDLNSEASDQHYVNNQYSAEQDEERRMRPSRDLISSVLKPAASHIVNNMQNSMQNHRQNFINGANSQSTGENSYNNNKRETRYPPQNQNQGSSKPDGNEPQVEGALKRPDGRRIMFLRTGDTQPYCSYQYQIVMELSSPFDQTFKPQMSIVLQDDRANDNEDTRSDSSSSSSDSSRRRDRRETTADKETVRTNKNSLSSEEFGYKVNDLKYTHLLTSAYKVRKITRGSILSLAGVDPTKIKYLHVNYMSNIDYKKRKEYSSTLCVVKTTNDKPKEIHGINPIAIHKPGDDIKQNRIYFADCNDKPGSTVNQGRPLDSTHSSSGGRRPTTPRPEEYSYQSGRSTSRRPTYGGDDDGYQSGRSTSRRPTYGGDDDGYQSGRSTSRRPTYGGDDDGYQSGRSTSRRPTYGGDDDGYQSGRSTSRKPYGGGSDSEFTFTQSSFYDRPSSTRKPWGEDDSYEGFKPDRSTTRRPYSDGRRPSSSTRLPFIDDEISNVSSSSNGRRPNTSPNSNHNTNYNKESDTDTKIISDNGDN